MNVNLTFNEHVISAVSSFMSRLGQMNRVKHAFDGHTLLVIINALVYLVNLFTLQMCGAILAKVI